MNKVSVTEVRARFGEILARVMAGTDIVITRRGLPVAPMSALEPQKKPMDLGAIDAFRAGLKPIQQRSVELVRRMRDESH